MEGQRGIRGAVAAAVALLPLLAATQTAAATAPPVIHVSEHLAAAPGAPTGQDFSMTIDAAGGDPAVKPPVLLREVLQLPDGARFDPQAIPQCDDTNQALLAAQLMARQTPCPAGSYLGVDHARMDTGNTAAPDSVRYILADVDEYNARGANGDEVVFVARDPSSGQPTTVFYGSVSGGTLSVNVPFVPGSPPDGQAADRGESQSLPPVGRYRVTPPSCPASGHWTSTSTFYFKDGATDTTGTLVEVVPSTTPCTAASTAGSPPGAAPPVGGGADPPSIATPNTGAASGAPDGLVAAAAILTGATLLHRGRRLRR